MMVLSVKGGQSTGKAAFNEGTLFKKIDGTVVGYEEGESWWRWLEQSQIIAVDRQ